MKHYPANALQAIFFGHSETKLLSWRDKTLNRMEMKYAKPCLLNDLPLKEQHWSRNKIKENTPNFAYRLREVDPEQDIVIINIDSTYQYTETVQSSHEIRKNYQVHINIKN